MTWRIVKHICSANGDTDLKIFSVKVTIKMLVVLNDYIIRLVTTSIVRVFRVP